MKNKLILEKNTKFEEAIRLLDQNGNGVLPVVNTQNDLLGLITDGDIRKAILNNQLELEHIINKKPYKLNISSSKSQIVNKLKELHRRHMPLVNDENKFIKMFTLDEVDFNLKPNWVVIMAGGLGTRLGELTKDTPKPMLKVGPKPMIEHIIDMFSSHGYTKFLISINYKAEVIKQYLKDGNHMGIDIHYIEEKKRLGTGGALSLIDVKIDEPFFVINGDVIASVDYDELLEFHETNSVAATMCIKKNSYKIPYGVIDFDKENNLQGLKEKPMYDYYINTGVYIFSPKVLNYIPKNEFFDLPELFKILKGEGYTSKVYEICDYWVDMGKVEDYEAISKKMGSFHG